MTFWIQHGYGKGEKIIQIQAFGRLNGGVILSPHDEAEPALTATAASVNSGVLLDPQLYAHTFEGGQTRHHESNGLDPGPIDWSIPPDEIAAYCKRLVALNNRVGTTAILTPTPFQQSFGDVWSPIALQFARATLAETDRDVYLSIAINGSGLADWKQVSRWLDAATKLDVKGVYLVVGASTAGYPPPIDVPILTNSLRFVYSLAELNGYELIWGYADLLGPLGIAAGAAGAASGWYHSLRSWNVSKWLPKSGGRQPNPRVLAQGLFAPLEVVGEAQPLATTASGVAAIPNEVLRQRLVDRTAIGLSDAWLYYLFELSDLMNAVDTTATVRDRVHQMSLQLSRARQLFDAARQEGAPLDPAHGTRLINFEAALSGFAKVEGL